MKKILLTLCSCLALLFAFTATVKAEGTSANDVANCEIIHADTVVIEESGKAYPEITVKMGDTILVEGVDYKYFGVYTDAVGDHWMYGRNGLGYIDGIGNYTGSCSFRMDVIPQAPMIKLSATDTSITAAITEGYGVVDGFHMQVSKKQDFSDIVGENDRSGNKITALTTTKLESGTKYYVRLRQYRLDNQRRFDSPWSEVASITTEGKKADLAKPSISNIKSTKAKTVNITWKKSKGAAGYQIQLATDTSFKKNVVKLTVKKGSTVSTKASKLKSGKMYYVRVRAYGTKKVSGKNKTVYSSWSGVKNVKVK